MLDDGRLAGKKGKQPQRPKRFVAVNETGRVIDASGNPVSALDSPPLETPDQTIADRVRRLEDLVQRDSRSQAEAFREAALQLQAAMERQTRALDLQAEANRELNAAVAEQAKIITGLLLADAERLPGSTRIT